MNHKSIIARLEELERKSGLNLPVVYARYQNGETVKYYGCHQWAIYLMKRIPLL